MAKLNKEEIQLLDIAVEEYWSRLGVISNSLKYDSSIRNAIENKRKEIDNIRLKLSCMFVEAFENE